MKALAEETATIESEFRHTANDRVLLVKSGLESYENGVFVRHTLPPCPTV